MLNLTIKAFQKDGDTVRFIYQLSGSLDLHVASCMNYTGMFDLMSNSQAKQLNNSVDIYDYRRELVGTFNQPV